VSTLHPIFAAILHTHFPVAPVLCCECDQPATHFTGPREDYDPHCDAHFAGHFAECPNCGTTAPVGDLFDICTAPQTFWSPAEGETRCVKCCPPQPEDDGDRAYDARGDR
jgi:hypothetical protein